MPLKILMLTQWFDPEPIFKGLTFAKELARRGHQVEVLTGFPNYPGGKVYPGYKIGLTHREVIEGIAVLRVPLYPSHDSSGWHRICNYGSFALSAAIIGAPQVSKPDVIFAYQPITIGLAAVAMKWAYGVPFVIDIQDLWPDFLPATGMINNKPALRLIDSWCSFIYRQAAHVTVLSPGYKKALIERGVPENKVDVIYNWCDERQIDTSARPDQALARQFGLEGRFNVLFAGTMGKAQALDAVLDAASILQARLPQVQFIFAGGGVETERLKNHAAHLKLANVLFLPWRPLNEIGQLISQAEVMLIHLKDDPIFEITIPSKTQTYLAMGKPILMGARGDVADLVLRAGAGIACQPQNPQSIAEGVSAMVKMSGLQLKGMGEKGRAFYAGELSLSAGTDKYLSIFNRLSY